MLRCERDGWSIEQGAKKGRKLPAWYVEEPDLHPADAIFFVAFDDLSSERIIADATMGPIPWHAIDAYADKLGIDQEAREIFRMAVRSLDNEYLQHRRDEMKKKIDRANADAKRRRKG